MINFRQINYWDLILVCLLMIATILLNKPLEDGFWRFDDPIILKCAVEYNFWQHFFIQEAYQCLTAPHLTPWLTFSYAIDYNLFGLEPKFFYFHQVFSIGLVSIFTFILLRLYVNPIISFFGVLIFLVGSPTWVISQQLMVRHYVEGLLFLIISIYFFILSLRFQKYRYTLLGCLFYILATSAKEIYVPLLGILLFIPEGKLKERFYAVIPYFIWGAIYILWRKYMLDVFIGGYSPTTNIFDYFNLQMLISLSKSSSFLLSQEFLKIILILLIFIALFILKDNFFLILVSIFCLVAPIIPLLSTGQIEFRFLFFPWWTICVLFTFGYSKIYSKKYYFISLILIMTLFVWGIIDKKQETKREMKSILIAFDKQGQFYWHENAQKIFFTPDKTVWGGGWYFSNLDEIKNKLGLSNPHVYSWLNLKFLPIDLLKKNTVWGYNSICQCMEKIDSEYLKNEIKNLNNTTLEKELSIFVKRTSNVVEWNFAPYNQGTYYIISEKLNVPLAKKSAALLYDQKLDFIIVYESPEGWITYSPEFTLEKNQTIDWKRP